MRWPGRSSRIAAIALLAVLIGVAAPARSQTPTEEGTGAGPTWVHADASGQPVLDLYFFWSLHCPHCREARPFVDELAASHPWLAVHAYEVTQEPANRARFLQMAEAVGERARGVPAFAFCGTMRFGFGTAETTGRDLTARIEQCYAAQAGQGPESVTSPPPDERPTVHLPLVGEVDLSALSLPVTTLVIAGLDAFNPCAFFVLLFLLSLLVNARSRTRMLLVSGIFVVFSGLFYFLFMAAWLNVFLWVGELEAVTVVAGLVAVGVAALNIKDYFWLRRGPSLSIPESARPGLFRRMRGLVKGTALTSVIAGTIVLAVAANSYELLCTSGFPLVYTRILTLEALPRASYYLYLVLYNAVYVLPLVAIIAVFVATLGRRKLQEEEGRILKLVSGLMMLGLGTLLLVAPGALGNVLAAACLLLGAVALTALVVALDRARQRGRRSGPRRGREPVSGPLPEPGAATRHSAAPTGR